MSLRTRRLLAVLAGLLAVPMIGLSVAWACTALATIDMDHDEGAVAGDVVKGTGEGFSATGSQVEIHLNGREGPLLASVAPGPTGAISFSFTTPQAAPGDYVVVATQLTATGEPVAGTPARAPFTILGPKAAPAPAQPAAPAEQQPARPAPAPAQAVPAQPAPAEPAPAQAAVPVPQAPEQAAPAAAVPPPVGPVEPAQVPAQAVVPADDRATTMAPQEQSLLLPLVMVAVGLLLTVGSGAAVLATRRPAGARAEARR